MTKEEEQQWIDVALRNHKTSFDYKPLEEHYRSEIENYGLKHLSKIKDTEEGYAKETQAKTKVYFDSLKANEEYQNKLFWRDIILQQKKKSVIVELNNRLLIVD